MAQQTTHYPDSNSLAITHVSVQINAGRQPSPYDALFSGMKSKVDGLSCDFIPRVPRSLFNTETHEKCFQPMVISLGPYHHDKISLRLMDKHKLEALECLMKSLEPHKCDLIYKQFEPVALEARKLYENVNVEEKSFIHMMFIDSYFLLNRLIQFRYGVSSRHSRDAMLVSRDMMMLENQIPLVVLNKLIFIMRDQLILLNHGDTISPTELLTTYVNKVIGIRCVGNPWYDEEDEDKSVPVHLLALVRKIMLGRKKKAASPPESEELWLPPVSVCGLKGAGIQCKKGETSYLREVSFKQHQKIKYFTNVYQLFLPPIVLDDNTKYLFHNMIAFEVSSGLMDHGIISYVRLMQELIDKEEDVMELRNNEVLEVRGLTDKEVVELFKHLGTDLISDQDAYADVKQEINKIYAKTITVVYERKVREHLNDFYRSYFNSPWKAIGLAVAIVLLVLQVVQTFFTIFPGAQWRPDQVESPPKPH